MNKVPENDFTRLASLDILRGFDLFLLVFFQPVFVALARQLNLPFLDEVLYQFDHEVWEGLRFRDLVMPLFLFMTGASMPFSLSKYKTASVDYWPVYRRILKRVILLFIFGMIVQGNLLGFDSKHIYFYSNTLQSIAVGYFIAAVIQLHFSFGWQIIITLLLLLAYWIPMTFLGDFTPAGNFAEQVDRWVLGRFRDGAKVVDGEVVFSPGYYYTWILSSLNFGVTVLTGLFAGYIAKDKTNDVYKLKWYFGAGAAMVAAGWLWGLQMPVIKTIWTSSMVLVSSGYCFLLMGLFYYLIDYKGYNKNITWLKVYGMNSIVAYMLANVINFSCLGESLFYGLQQYMGNYYSFLISLSNILVIYVILWWLYKRNIFLKV